MAREAGNAWGIGRALRNLACGPAPRATSLPRASCSDKGSHCSQGIPACAITLHRRGVLGVRYARTRRPSRCTHRQAPRRRGNDPRGDWPPDDGLLSLCLRTIAGRSTSASWRRAMGASLGRRSSNVGRAGDRLCTRPSLPREMTTTQWNNVIGRGAILRRDRETLAIMTTDYFRAVPPADTA